MSTTDAAVIAPKSAGKKKLIIMLAAVLLLVLVGGGATALILKKKHADEVAAAEADGDEESAGDEGSDTHAKVKFDPHKVPTFVPLETFVVNLADRDAERFAQVGVTLEVDDPKFAEEIKAYMPAIRNGILLVLAHKTSAQLLDRDGKLALAREIMRESVRPLGIEVGDEPDAKDTANGDEDAPKKKSKKKRGTEHNPVTNVLFSNFIIQ